MKKQKSQLYFSYYNDIVNILKRFSIAFDQAQNLKLLLGCTSITSKFAAHKIVENLSKLLFIILITIRIVEGIFGLKGLLTFSI